MECHSRVPSWNVIDAPNVHPGRLTWNLQIIHLERKMIFETSMIMFHVNLQRCIRNIYTYMNGLSLWE